MLFLLHYKRLLIPGIKAEIAFAEAAISFAYTWQLCVRGQDFSLPVSPGPLLLVLIGAAGSLIGGSGASAASSVGANSASSANNNGPRIFNQILSQLRFQIIVRPERESSLNSSQQRQNNGGIEATLRRQQMRIIFTLVILFVALFTIPSAKAQVQHVGAMANVQFEGKGSGNGNIAGGRSKVSITRAASLLKIISRSPETLRLSGPVRHSDPAALKGTYYFPVGWTRSTSRVG